MSRIYFHAVDDTAEVYGSEFAYFGRYCAWLTYIALDPILDDLPRAPSRFRRALPADHFIHELKPSDPYRYLQGSKFRDSVTALLGVGESRLAFGGVNVGAGDMELNTALAVGSDAVRLAARLYGQCELHAWVDGPNRKWLAGIIRAGRGSGLFRAGAGWESVIALLEAADDSPVVTSYSVSDPFPDCRLDPQVSAADGDGWWYGLPVAEQWRRAFAGLRAMDGGLELRPDNFAAIRFDGGFSAYDLVEALQSGG